MPENGESNEETAKGPSDPAAADGPSAGPEVGEAPLPEEEAGRWNIRSFARKIMDRPLAEDTRDLLLAVLNTSDKAKTEMVRMVAREVRTYLAELKLKEDLVDVMRNHSLEISVSLKPIAKIVDRPSDEPDE